MRTNAALFVHIPLLTPERRIWRAVLEQAYADAETVPDPDFVCDLDTRVCARRFLRAAGPIEAALLSLVCDRADVPFDRVVLWARKRYTSEPLEPSCLEELIAGQTLADKITAIRIAVAKTEILESTPN
jgi:hypothetical protein